MLRYLAVILDWVDLVPIAGNSTLISTSSFNVRATLFYKLPNTNSKISIRKVKLGHPDKAFSAWWSEYVPLLHLARFSPPTSKPTIRNCSPRVGSEEPRARIVFVCSITVSNNLFVELGMLWIKSVPAPLDRVCEQMTPVLQQQQQQIKPSNHAMMTAPGKRDRTETQPIALSYSQ